MNKTKLKLKTLDTRGGLRTKRKNPSPYSLLLEAIWNKFGGPVAVARKLSIHWQAPVNWKIRGEVPLSKIAFVSSDLKIPIWGLNYEECIKLYPSEKLNWEEVVKLYFLPGNIEGHILKESKKYFKGKK